MRRKTIQFINSHPLNRSKTKQAHSFSRSPRFKESSPLSFSEYNLSSSAVQLRPKSAGIVFTKQRRFRDTNNLKRQKQFQPSPQSYKSPDFFQQSLKKKKGISFNHAQKLKTSYVQQPGPGSYQINKYNPQHVNAYTISKQKKKKTQFWNKVGPGQYLKDNYLKKSSKNITIGRQKRFKYGINQNPAPGQHSHTTSFYQQSNVYRKQPNFSFGRSNRQSTFTSRASLSPGPGQYNVQFSEFSERTKRIFNILNRL